MKDKDNVVPFDPYMDELKQGCLRMAELYYETEPKKVRSFREGKSKQEKLAMAFMWFEITKEAVGGYEN